MNNLKKVLRCRRIVGTVLAVAAIGAQAAPPAASISPSIGTWKLNLKESVAQQGVAEHEYTLVVRRSDSQLVFDYKSTDEKGQPVSFTWDLPSDGVVRKLSGAFAGARGTVVRLPAGTFEFRLWRPDGSYENKFCQVSANLKQTICLATVTAGDGSVSFFRQVLDKQ